MSSSKGIEWIEAYRLTCQENYKGPEEDQLYSYEGYTVLWAGKKYRLGPKVLFRPYNKLARSESGAPTTKVEPAKASAPVTEPTPARLTLAKKLYEVGVEASGPLQPWNKAVVKVQTFMLGIAAWHLEKVKHLEAVIEQLKQLTRDRAMAKPPPPITIQRMDLEEGRDSNLKSKIANRKITMADKKRRLLALARARWKKAKAFPRGRKGVKVRL
jgi:hypothetical protein